MCIWYGTNQKRIRGERVHQDQGRFADAAQVLDAIRRMIENDRLPADARLPTERELAAELGSARRSVRCALDSLESEGLIWRKQRKGTFAGQPPDPTEELAAKIVSEVDSLAAMEARLCIEPALADLCACWPTAWPSRPMPIRRNSGTERFTGSSRPGGGGGEGAPHVACREPSTLAPRGRRMTGAIDGASPRDRDLSRGPRLRPAGRRSSRRARPA